MSKSSIGWRKAGISSLATAALVAGACVAGAGAASATTNFNLHRVQGPDRYGTSAAIAGQSGKAQNVIVASGAQGHYADALAANYLAGIEKAPVLLTKKGSMPTAVDQAIKDSGASNVWIIGGTDVVSQAQEDQLKSEGYNVQRLSGENRWLTDAAVIGQGGKSSGEGIVATGLNFPDALGAGPLAYAKDMPLAISKTHDISDSVVKALQNAGVTKVLIAGGTDVVGREVVAKLATAGITVDQRFAGTDRADTAAQIAKYELANGFTNTAVNVASGAQDLDGVDALGGGALSGSTKTPMLITKDVIHPGQATLNYLTSNANTLANGDVFGGPNAVSDDAVAQMNKAAQAVTSNQSYTVSGTDQNVNVSGNRTYSASGIAPNTDVTIQLFNCDNVSTGTNGQTTFTGTNPGGTGNVALPGTVAHETITVVNGTSQGTPTQKATATSDSNGDVTFTVTNDGTAGECVVPVVYNDANNDNFLDLNKDNTPSESFGTGGSSTFVNPAQQGTINSAGTQTVSNPTSSTFQEGGATYTYDAGDQYQLVKNSSGSGSVVPDSYADFQQRLSTGDSVTGYYNPNGQSVFTLTDSAPAPSASVLALPEGTVNTKQAGKGGVEVAFTASPTSKVTSYNVYRATATQPAITGQGITCPTPANAGTTNSPQTPPGAPFTKVGSVDASASTTSYTPSGGSAGNYYTFEDTTAQAPSATTPNNPEYCYVVTSVAATGQEGNPSDVAGPATASTASTAPTATTPMFSATGNSATGTGGTYTIKTTYTTAAVGAVDADGSDYTVTLNDGGAAYALKVTGASVSGNVVTITATAANGAPAAPTSGDSVIVGAKNGTDGNTVSDAQTPPTYQPVGDQVYIPTT